MEVVFLVAVHHGRGWWVSSLGEVSQGEIRESSACLAELTSTLSLPVVELLELRFVVSASCLSSDVRRSSSASKSGNQLACLIHCRRIGDTAVALGMEMLGNENARDEEGQQKEKRRFPQQK